MGKASKIRKNKKLTKTQKEQGRQRLFFIGAIVLIVAVLGILNK